MTINQFSGLGRPDNRGAVVAGRNYRSARLSLNPPDVCLISERARRLSKLGSFCNTCVRSTTSRRGYFAVLIWRSKQSRSGGELPLVAGLSG
jgi:hypothetical protein